MPTSQEAKFQNAMDGTVLAMRQKTSFLLNKSTTQCPRPIAIKPHFLFFFVLHAHFPSHDSFPFQILGELYLMGAHTLSKRIVHIPCPWHCARHRAQPNSPYKTAARSQACSATLGRKQAREWILLVSYLDFKQDVKCYRTFQTSECSPS